MIYSVRKIEEIPLDYRRPAGGGTSEESGEDDDDVDQNWHFCEEALDAGRG